MSKKTGFNKTLGRTDYVVRETMNRLPKAPFKEVVTYLDFTGQKLSKPKK